MKKAGLSTRPTCFQARNEVSSQVLFAACSQQHTKKHKPNIEFMRLYWNLIKATYNSKTEARADFSQPERHWNSICHSLVI